MSTTAPLSGAEIDRAELLPPEARAALRDLLLVLADSKRLLGIRFSDWMLGAPTLESGIAASSMAQDEWGHGRLTYALLSDFGDDPKQLEHERTAAEYRSPELLDLPFHSWNELIAAGLLIDTALSVQYAALRDSRYAPVHNRVQKLLDEEQFHFQHATGWTRRLARSPAVRAEFGEMLAAWLPPVLRWFGRPDSVGARGMVREGVMRDGADALRAHFLQRIAPLLQETGFTPALGLVPDGSGWRCTRELDWNGWNDATRRAGGDGPDAETLAQVRGDKNRELLLD